MQKIAKLLQQVGSDITVTGCTHELNFMDLSHRSVGAMWETHIPSLRLTVSQVVGESLVGSLTLSWRTATGCNSKLTSHFTVVEYAQGALPLTL